MLVVLAFEPDQIEIVPGLLLALGPRHATHAQTELDIAQRRQPAVERIVALEDDAAVGGRAGDRMAVDADRAVAHRLEARHHVEHRGLAAAAGAEQAEELAGLDVEREVSHGDIIAALQRTIDLADLGKLDERHGAYMRDGPPSGPEKSSRACARFARR